MSTGSLDILISLRLSTGVLGAAPLKMFSCCRAKGIVLAGLDILQFSFFLAGGNHQQVCTTDSAIVETVLNNIVLLLYDILKCSSSPQDWHRRLKHSSKRHRFDNESGRESDSVVS